MLVDTNIKINMEAPASEYLFDAIDNVPVSKLATFASVREKLKIWETRKQFAFVC